MCITINIIIISVITNEYDQSATEFRKFWEHLTMKKYIHSGPIKNKPLRNYQ